MVRKIANVFVHLNFLPNVGLNDIALLLLDEPLYFDGTSASCAAIPAQGERLPFGSVGKVSGWGQTTERAGSGSTMLRTTYLTVQSFDQCQEVYQGRHNLDDEAQYCIGNNEIHTGSCQRDSGGPFVVDNTVYGVVSWAEICADSKHPTVYTDVGAYAKWIHRTVKSLHEKLDCNVM
ncbi:trypsin eta-like [Wyeomyia smithii]|uniref:trypsin eta-like n=1 Tax=Wyeomyia smithii TaxID=174621 RepID=UPI0024680152|nr:trypsin eta-like [Wyeomyia smithii]